MRHETFG
jgi:hypothetical protein